MNIIELVSHFRVGFRPSVSARVVYLLCFFCTLTLVNTSTAIAGGYEYESPSAKNEILEAPEEVRGRFPIASTTLIAAAMETLGYHYQSHILDGITDGLLGSVATLIVVISGIVALFIVAVVGRYELAIWFLLGPGLFYAVLFPRTEIEGVGWIFGDEVRNQRVKEALVEDLAGGELETPRVPSLFKSFLELLQRPLNSAVAVLKSERYQQDLRFVVRMQLYGALTSATVDNPGLRELIHVGFVGQGLDRGSCLEKILASESLIDETTTIKDRIAAYKMIVDSDQRIILPPAAIDYVAELSYYFPDLLESLLQKKYRSIGVFKPRLHETMIPTSTIQCHSSAADDPMNGVDDCNQFKFDFEGRANSRKNNLALQLANLSDEEREIFEQYIENVNADIAREAESGASASGNISTGGNSPHDRQFIGATLDLASIFETIRDPEVDGPVDETRLREIRSDVATRGFECEEIWALTYIGISDYARQLVLREEDKTARMGIDPEEIYTDFLTLSGFGLMTEADRKLVVPERQDIPDNEFEKHQLLTAPENIELAEKRIMFFRAVAKHIFKSEIATAGPHSVVATIAHRGTEYSKLSVSGEPEISYVERMRTRNRQWAERTNFVNSASQVPYYQGIVLYILAITYPFFAFLLLIPGKHGGFLIWFALWFWAKLWDVGYVVVMLLDELFFMIFTAGYAGLHESTKQFPVLPAELVGAVGSLRAIDPTFNMAAYYNVISVAMTSIPVVTLYLVSGSIRAGAGLIAEGMENYNSTLSQAAWKANSQLGVHGHAQVARDRKLSAFRGYMSSDKGGAVGVGGSSQQLKLGSGPNSISNIAERMASGVLPSLSLGGASRHSLSSLKSGFLSNTALSTTLNTVSGHSGTSAVGDKALAKSGYGSGDTKHRGYRVMAWGSKSAQAFTRLAGRISGSYAGMHRGAYSDRMEVMRYWSALDSLLSKESAADMEDARLYDVFELPYMDEADDGRRVELWQMFQNRTRRAELIGEYVEGAAKLLGDMIDIKQGIDDHEEKEWLDAANFQAEAMKEDERRDKLDGQFDRFTYSDERRAHYQRGQTALDANVANYQSSRADIEAYKHSRNPRGWRPSVQHTGNVVSPQAKQIADKRKRARDIERRELARKGDRDHARRHDEQQRVANTESPKHVAGAKDVDNYFEGKPGYDPIINPKRKRRRGFRSDDDDGADFGAAPAKPKPKPGGGSGGKSRSTVTSYSSDGTVTEREVMTLEELRMFIND